MSHKNIVVLPPGIGIPPFLVSLPDERGQHWQIMGNGLGSDAFISFDQSLRDDDPEIEKQNIIDNGWPIKTSMDGYPYYFQSSNINELRIVFQSGTGNIRIAKVKP